MISIPLIVVATVTVAIGALLRPLLGRWIDARNIAQLQRRYSLDGETAEDLYRLARREGFGSAWETVVDGRRDQRRRTVERRETKRTSDRRQTADRRLADRHRA